MIDTAPAPTAQLSPEALAQVRIFQQNEVTESEVYRRIAAGTKDESNRAALLRIADEEAKHAAIWQRYTGEAMKPGAAGAAILLIARVFGFTFAVKLMERGEEKLRSRTRAGERSARGAGHPRRRGIARAGAAGDAGRGAPVVRGQHGAGHERRHGGDDRYAGGSDAGYAEHARLIALSGLITGIAATLSMASSEYLSSKSEGVRRAEVGFVHGRRLPRDGSAADSAVPAVRRVTHLWVWVPW
ncbi:MAG: hypothetical protein ACLR3C_04325 [Eggerthella lenta]